MSRIIRIVLALLALQTVAACGTLAGAAIGGGIGSTQGHTAEGAAIGAGAGAIYDIERNRR